MAEPLDELPPARFSHRLLAFVADAAPFIAAYWATAVALQVGGGMGRLRLALLFWFGAWLAYHALAVALWGRTFGKRLLGLRIVGLDGEAPGPLASALRAAGYLLSGAVFNAGFLWALRGEGRAWHDLLVDTRVVEVEPLNPKTRTAASVAGWVLGGILALAWFGLVVVGPGLARMKLLAQARTGLKGLAYLEERYAAKHGGEYAPDLKTLLADSPEGAELAKALPFHLNPDSVVLTASPGAYAIEGDALDIPPTRLRFDGPAEKR